MKPSRRSTDPVVLDSSQLLGFDQLRKRAIRAGGRALQQREMTKLGAKVGQKPAAKRGR